VGDTRKMRIKTWQEHGFGAKWMISAYLTRTGRQKFVAVSTLVTQWVGD